MTGTTPVTQHPDEPPHPLPGHPPQSDEQQARISSYLMLSTLLSRPPDPAALEALNHIDTENTETDGDVGIAWKALKVAGAGANLQQLDTEYHDLFIGLGRGQVVPYGSWHLTGFLMEKPLSELRQDLRMLGLVASETEKDPEDHIATLCECMAIIIAAEDISESQESAFFNRHLWPWARKFFAELSAAKSADFYQAVGQLGTAFIEFDHQYLDL